MFLDLAALHRKSGKYDDAYQLYHTITTQLVGCHKLRPFINKTICMIESGQLRQARKEVRWIIRVVEESRRDENMIEMFSEIDSQLRNLAERFIESHDYCSAITLARCRFDIVKVLRQDGLTRLLCLEKMGLLIQNISEEMASTPKRPRTKSTYNRMCCLLDEILEEMQDVSGVDTLIKCSRVAWFLKYIGFCSDEMEDFQRSLVVYNQAIMLMKTVYGSQAAYHKVLGFCYNNLAYVYERTDQFHDAIKVLKRAVDIFHDAVDWSSEEDKARCIAKAVATLQTLKERTPQCKLFY